ncbi:MAG: mechanosensitive ion channel family protein [Patescibacteria group bacterium]|nr:mechanosensitive ion channel family protein [Patescibacteria group bacterium]
MNFNFIESISSKSEMLSYRLGDNTIFQYLIALGVFVISAFVLIIFKKIIIHELKRIVKRTSIKFDDVFITMIDAIGKPFYILLSFYVAIRFIEIPWILYGYLSKIILIFAIYYIVKSIQVLIDYWTNKLAVEKKETLEIDSSSAKFLGRILKIILWIIAVILVLQNLGYNISTLVAGLGIGGIAVALALQNVLEDIFASFSIHFDKPFQVDDFIVIGKEMGTVKSIGIKSTRLEALQGEELIISNRELTEARVHNFRRMDKRRILFSIGVAYETSAEKLKKIPSIITKIGDRIDLVNMDRVNFKEFADFSLIFEVVYFLNSTDFNVFVQKREQINLEIKEKFEKEGIEIAYPTQTVFIKK